MLMDTFAVHLDFSVIDILELEAQEVLNPITYVYSY